ncbi:hypothetical protein KXQ82_04615 [Mucilaginibacter sp. HMF5004]|uniref:hypothetical protein n=1 Tax=Mucilaginibacter rivuli TaxID=2857527 RepID=UPI001C5E3829|nr:hypothetical protein [Mucilaginibacter rivuli]MBW4888981.1 hypothetical protein [Mucilaginibacter rivuli]
MMRIVIFPRSYRAGRSFRIFCAFAHLLPRINLHVLCPALLFVMCSFPFVVQCQSKNNSAAYGFVRFNVKGRDTATFRLSKPAYPFPGRKNVVIRVMPELEGATGVKSAGKITVLELSADAEVLIALPQTFDPQNDAYRPILDSALTIAGLPPYRIYALRLPSGIHSIDKESEDGFIAAVIAPGQTGPRRNGKKPDGREWRPYLVDGFLKEKPLFEILSGNGQIVIDEGMPGTEGIQGGFESGTCVKVSGVYHLFPTERAGKAGKGPEYDRVKTRIGHWESNDAIHWTRTGTVYQSSGTYAISESDNPMNDRRGAIWSFNAVFNKEADRWYGYYLSYTVDKNIRPNHSFGRIWRTISQTKGFAGIGGPYDEGTLIMEPGLDSQPWEGRQGVASFYPFPVEGGWLAFYAGAFPFHSWADYPKKTSLGWLIGLASAKTMDGPWTRLDTTMNPVKSINPEFLENPLVYKLKDEGYIAIFDGGPDDNGHHFVNMIGYAVSRDGLHWSEARYIPLHTKIQAWWNVMRTPLCLIPEGDNNFTVLFAAINSKRFHPIGSVRLKMDTRVFEQLLKF